MGSVAIHTEELTRDFGSLRALDGLTLDVPSGSVFGYLGPNGAGKTTTLHLLLGLARPTRGTAYVLGHDVVQEADAVRKRTGALLEHHGLYERLSAEHNLEYFGRLHHMESTDLKPRIRELLSEVGLWERRRETAGTWSRGMKQKLAVARALLHHPELVFLDEPTAGQDPQSAAEFRQSLVALAKREGVTVFLTTHNLVEAERICDRVAVIRQGKLLAVGAPAQLRSHGSKPRLEVVGRNFKPATIAALRKLRGISSAETRNGSLILQLDGNVSVAPIVKKLVASGAEVEEVRRETKSLEDFFLSLIKEEA